MPRVFVGLGSNIEPEKNLPAAATLLREKWPALHFSRVYRSAPIGEEHQAHFLNAVGYFETEEDPQEILEKFQSIERKLKKATPYLFGPRTIDLDLLLYGDTIIHGPSFSIPHPRMHERRFVLAPLLEFLSPQEQHPLLHQSWAKLLVDTEGQQCESFSLKL